MLFNNINIFLYYIREFFRLRGQSIGHQHPAQDLLKCRLKIAALNVAHEKAAQKRDKGDGPFWHKIWHMCISGYSSDPPETL